MTEGVPVEPGKTGEGALDGEGEGAAESPLERGPRGPVGPGPEINTRCWAGLRVAARALAWLAGRPSRPGRNSSVTTGLLRSDPTSLMILAWSSS